MYFLIVSRQRSPASPHLKRSMLNSIQHGAFRLWWIALRNSILVARENQQSGGRDIATLP